MSEGDISQISVGEFETVSQLLASSESLQLAFIIMIVGIIAIAAAYRKFSSLIKSKKIFYTRPHLSKFVQNAVLPFFAIALIILFSFFFNSDDLYLELNLTLNFALADWGTTFSDKLSTFIFVNSRLDGGMYLVPLSNGELFNFAIILAKAVHGLI